MRWQKNRLPTFEPNVEGVAEAEKALTRSHQVYAIAVSRSLAERIQAARTRSIRERNGFGPAIQAAVGRPR